MMLIGVGLIAIGFLIPLRTVEWVRAIPVVVGAILVLISAVGLLLLPRSNGNH